jgi:hypothetical protein
LDRSGKRIEGPSIADDDLYVRFKQYEHEKLPEIVVRSDVYESDIVRLRLNLSDKSKPEFELVEDRGMGVVYLPPWQDYYERDATYKLLPKK